MFYHTKDAFTYKKAPFRFYFYWRDANFMQTGISS